MDAVMKGVKLTPLKIFKSDLGKVMHAMNCDDKEFTSFGEAYFSTVKRGAIKGWKRHSRMVLNLVVPVGRIRFVIFDDRGRSEANGKYFEVTLSVSDNYQRITIEPGLWVAFEGIDDGESILLNLASIKHSDDEVESCNVESGIMKYPR